MATAELLTSDWDSLRSVEVLRRRVEVEEQTESLSPGDRHRSSSQALDDKSGCRKGRTQHR